MPMMNLIGDDNTSRNVAGSSLGTVPTVFISVGVAIIILGTITGNVLVCLAVLLVRKLRHPGNYLLISLAVSDFCVAVFVMPFAYLYLIQGNWIMGDILCNLWTCADVTLCTASILNLCAISVDRYWAISKPLLYAAAQRTTKRILTYVLCVWLLALLISVLPVIALERPRTASQCEVSQNIYYQIYATLFSFYIPTTIMIVLNFKIYLAARRMTRQDRASMISVNSKLIAERRKESLQVRRISNNYDDRKYSVSGVNPSSKSSTAPSPHVCRSSRSKSGDSSDSRLIRRLRDFLALTRTARLTSDFLRAYVDPTERDWMRREHKALKTLGLLMGAYITCWLPFFLLALVKSICRENCNIPIWLDALFLWLGYCNSMLNPLIYAKCNRDFRIPFRELLCCRYKTLKMVIRNELFTEKYGNQEHTKHCKTKIPPLLATTAKNELNFELQDNIDSSKCNDITKPTIEEEISEITTFDTSHIICRDVSTNSTFPISSV